MPLNFEAVWDSPAASSGTRSDLDCVVLEGDGPHSASRLPSIEKAKLVAHFGLILDASIGSVRELYVDYGPLSGSLSFVPELERLFLTHAGELRDPPPGLRDLICPVGMVQDAATGLQLERLRSSGAGNPVLAEPERLTWLSVRPSKGAAALLRPCTGLQRLDLELDHSKLASLSALGPKHALQECTLAWGGLGSLRGLEDWPALKRLTMHRTTVDSLDPLANSAIEELWLRPAPPRGDPLDLAPVGRMPLLRRARLDATGTIASLGDWSRASELEELRLGEAVLGHRALDGLLELPKLRRIAIDGVNVREAKRFASARPDVDVETFTGLATRTPTQVISRVSIYEDRSRWWIEQDLTSELGVHSNHDAEEAVRDELTNDSGVEFDSDADFFFALAPTKAEIVRVAHVINDLAEAVTSK